MPDHVDRELRRVTAAFADAAPDPPPYPGPTPGTKTHRRVRGPLIAVGAAVLTVALIAVPVLLLRGGDETDVGGPAQAPTTIPVPTTPPPDTTTTVTTTTPPTTTPSLATVPTTTPPPTTSTPPPTTAPPFDGEIPDLSVGWVDDEVEIAGPAAVGPAGIAAFDDERAWFNSSGDAWEPAGLEIPPVKEIFDIAHLAGGPVGLVAAGHLDESPVVYQSENGTTWTSTEPWSFPVEVMEIASGPTGFLLFGRAYDGCNSLVVLSADRREWTTIDFPGDCVVTSAVWLGDRWIAASSNSAGIVLVHESQDGIEWNSVAMEEPPGETGTFGLHLAGHDQHLVLLGDDPSTSPPGLAVWYSTDGGHTWARADIDAPEDAPAGEYQPWELIYSELGYLAVGGIETLGDRAPGFILYSPDGTEWHQFTLQSMWFRDIVVADGTIIGFGNQGTWHWEPAG